ncbi:RNA 2'-phosphotransferase [Roseateles sp. DB2]|uniref:RNA 2'-phosphotransferase n=1 Tax=Roseateles sp. DB2 TaxID=3453717 RepID=UPI003EEADA30
MSNNNLIETSKFLSYVLRHEPQAIGLELDHEGWGSLDVLIAGAVAQGRPLTPALVEQVVASSDKKRFELSVDGQRIRAVQGHSTLSVAREFVAQTPPAVLFHGTATRFLDAIRQEGLKPGQRHHVHLSADEQTARAVGQRYGAPVVLRVDAAGMHASGTAFYQAENGVWLTSAVPAQFISDGDPI